MSADLEPGLAGVRPFRFECHRCGRCCRTAEGHVWLAPGEDARLAGRLGLATDVFRSRFVRTVRDPASGSLREALREDDRRAPGNGRCVLLEDDAQCTVYDDRPEHCRAFPYWPSVLESEAGFEAAASVCPGIEEEVPREVRPRAHAALAALYARLDEAVASSRVVCLARGVCCHFETAGHEPWATRLEVEYCLEHHPEPAEPAAPGRCPYHQGGRCTAREGRPLGCRTYFCDPDLEDAFREEHEALFAELRDLEAEHGYPHGYAPFPASVLRLARRRAAPTRPAS